MGERKGIPIIASSPQGKQKTYVSKRAACRAIGCKMVKLNRVIGESKPLAIEGTYYWVDELKEG